MPTDLKRVPDPNWRAPWTQRLRRVEARSGAAPVELVSELTINDALPVGFRRLCDDHDIATVADLYAEGYSLDGARRYLEDNQQARERVMLHEAGCLYR